MKFRATLNALTFGTTIWAFLMLVVTGSVHVVATIAFSLGFLGAIAHAAGLVPSPPWFWRIANIGAIAAATWGWMRTDARIDSVVYLFMYLAVSRAWNLSRSRDYLQLHTLGFFIVLAASVSTASLGFAPMILAYVALMLAALVTLTLHRDCDAALEREHAGLFLPRRRTASDPRRISDDDDAERARLDGMPFLTPAAVTLIAGATMFILVVASGLFVVIPRLEVGSLFRGFSGAAAGLQSTGFSDSVVLGGVGAIQTDPAIAMRVTPVSPETGKPVPRPAEFIRLRGTTLEFWDGRRWDKAPQVLSDATALRDSREALVGDDSAIDRSLEYQIMLEPVGTTYLFLPGTPVKVAFERRVRVKTDSFSRTVALDRPPAQVISYRVMVERRAAESGEAAEGQGGGPAPPASYSHAARRLVEDVLPRFLASGGTAAQVTTRGVRLSPDRVELLTRLPDTPDIATVRQFAASWTGAFQDQMLIAREIEGRFQRTFGYTLDTSAFSNSENHLTRFLTEARRGHCEYFATAMVLMLRARGIPARVVNGYVSDEWSESQGGYYVVRQQNAHSWVEAFITGRGWTMFDPTPADGMGSARNPETIYTVMTRWMDGVRLIWYRYVVDYSAADQQKFLIALFRNDGVRSGFHWMRRMDRELEVRIGSDTVKIGISRAIMSVVGAVLLVGLIAAAHAQWRRLRQRRSRAGPPHTATRAPIKPFLDLMRACEQELPRPPGTTPLEYARNFARMRPEFEPLTSLTREYYASRFHVAAWTREHSALAAAMLEQLRIARRAERSAR